MNIVLSRGRCARSTESAPGSSGVSRCQPTFFHNSSISSSTFADRYHHGKEETHLFPALERQGIQREGGALAALEHEHQIESKLASEMRLALQEYRSVDTAARERFIVAARRYTNHLLSHIDKEDSILFRLADEILDDEDKASLIEGFKLAEQEFGAGASEKYDRIASALEQQWAV